jgi:Plasmid pRiA4b ORF-3-like protein
MSTWTNFNLAVEARMIQKSNDMAYEKDKGMAGEDNKFGYWFDFGNDWWHKIDAVPIEQKNEKGDYPKVIKRVGEIPPQYADMD